MGGEKSIKLLSIYQRYAHYFRASCFDAIKASKNIKPALEVNFGENFSRLSPSNNDEEKRSRDDMFIPSDNDRVRLKNRTPTYLSESCLSLESPPMN